MQTLLQDIRQQASQLLFQVPHLSLNSRLSLSELQRNNLSHFEKIILYPQLGIPYIQEELQNSLFLQVTTVMVQTVFLSYDEHNRRLFSFDLVLGMQMNLVLVLSVVSALTKGTLLSRLNSNSARLGDLNSNESSRFLILFFLCRLYQLNIRLSKFTNLFYFLLTFRIWQLKQVTTHLFLNTAFVLVVLFYVRMILSQIKYQIQFCHHKISRLSGLTDQQLYSLTTVSWSAGKKEIYNEQDLCSICYEHFQEGQVVMVLSCTGQHIFHQNCIQRWLIFKKTCPNCNTLAARSSHPHQGSL